MDEILKIGNEILKSQPFSKFINSEITGLSPGYAELSLKITENVKQQFGFVHGGVISYVADTAIAFAGGSVLGRKILTLEYKINFLKPAVGEKLIGRARVIYSSKSHAVCHCDVFFVNEGKETLCAVAQGTIVKPNQELNGS